VYIIRIYLIIQQQLLAIFHHLRKFKESGHLGELIPYTLEENWYFDLDNSRDVCYYICISTERLEKMATYTKLLLKILKINLEMHSKMFLMPFMNRLSNQTLGFALPIPT
jgi:hypothetical protein